MKKKIMLQEFWEILKRDTQNPLFEKVVTSEKYLIPEKLLQFFKQGNIPFNTGDFDNWRLLEVGEIDLSIGEVLRIIFKNEDDERILMLSDNSFFSRTVPYLDCSKKESEYIDALDYLFYIESSKTLGILHHEGRWFSSTFGCDGDEERT